MALKLGPVVKVAVFGLMIGLYLSLRDRGFGFGWLALGIAIAWAGYIVWRHGPGAILFGVPAALTLAVTAAASIFIPRLRRDVRQMITKREISRNDILPFEAYAAEREDRRTAMMAVKKNRRMEVGPFATLYFENYDTMWHQIHEMLHIERGGEEQIEDELRAYNPLIPKGTELVATVMFEIDDEVRRANVLARLGGVEDTAMIQFDGETVRGEPEEDVDRTNAAGKASSVQFIHFPFTHEQIEKFSKPGIQVLVGFGHENYGHMAVMPEPVRAALAADFA